MWWIPESANDKYNVKTYLEINRREINTELLSQSIIKSGWVVLFISGNKITIATTKIYYFLLGAYFVLYIFK